MSENWLIDVENELQKIVDSSIAMEPLKISSIYKIPSFIADQNSKVYRPAMVSFGPYHHGDDNLKPMEFHKQRSLVRFLERTKESLKTIVNSFAEVADELKNSYDSLDPAWKKDTRGFLKLMIVDGCFMLEILNAHDNDQKKAAANDNTVEDYAADDSIFGDHGKLYVMPVIKRDMLMLENQLPILVLVKLLSIRDNNDIKDGYINNLILKFCNPDPYTRASNTDKCLHVLDVFRKSQFKKDFRTSSKKQDPKEEDLHGEAITRSRSATELKEAGVGFKRIKKVGYLNDITFQGGVLRLPTFIIDDATESIFLNMAAFERCHVGTGNEATSYICFMDNLIDDAVDIRLLQWENIVQNFIGSDKGAAELFNTISKDLTIDPASSLDLVHQNLTIYCSNTWNRYRATLAHKYFTDPWAKISVIAASSLLVLTVWQAVFGAMSYFQDKKKN